MALLNSSYGLFISIYKLPTATQILKKVGIRLALSMRRVPMMITGHPCTPASRSSAGPWQGNVMLSIVIRDQANLMPHCASLSDLCTCCGGVCAVSSHTTCTNKLIADNIYLIIYS